MALFMLASFWQGSFPDWNTHGSTVPPIPKFSNGEPEGYGYNRTRMVLNTQVLGWGLRSDGIIDFGDGQVTIKI